MAPSAWVRGTGATVVGRRWQGSSATALGRAQQFFVDLGGHAQQCGSDVADIAIVCQLQPVQLSVRKIADVTISSLIVLSSARAYRRHG
jgi:RES domain-containing protein